MYLIPIHVPIYVDSGRKLVTTDWKKSLEMLRDSFEGQFGRIVVVAPSCQLADTDADQVVEPLDGDADIELRPSIRRGIRARQYWLKHRRAWLADCKLLIQNADVVHAGLDDVFKPMMYHAWRLADHMGMPTVFVQDTDIVLQQRELARSAPAARRLKSKLYATYYERWCRKGVARADLALLKGQSLHQRYGAYARNAKDFHDTSYTTDQIITADALDRRTTTLSRSRPLRFVFCGRFVRRKGIDASIRLVTTARDRGAEVDFDLIGDGPERSELESLVEKLGAARYVRFLGSIPYGTDLLNRLGSYDAILFTPSAEDTPRMIFDGYAAGLPLIATDIAYVRERAEQDRTVLLLPRDDEDATIEILLGLCREPTRLRELAKRSRTAAEYHAADRWYRRRAEWTIEAVGRHRRKTRNPQP
ncbi:MAG: glycosyltransferase [Pirellulales bacterium]|nr:glycosyltransferase [Pirellulales bacterium]